MIAPEPILVRGAFQAMAERTWQIRHLLRHGSADLRAAVHSLSIMEECAPPRLRKLVSSTIREALSLVPS